MISLFIVEEDTGMSSEPVAMIITSESNEMPVPGGAHHLSSPSGDLGLAPPTAREATTVFPSTSEPQVGEVAYLLPSMY